MKIVISASDGTLEAPYAAHFGRAAYFLVVDTESDTWQAVANPAVNASSGAGVQSAQLAVNHGAQAVISGSFGPHAYQILMAAGVPMFLAPAGTAPSARQLLDWYKAGQLQQIAAPTSTGGCQAEQDSAGKGGA
jgi:predicted Fe-Mo cluster-binding NifX family protein